MPSSPLRHERIFELFKLIAPYGGVFTVNFFINSNDSLTMRFDAFIEPAFWQDANVGMLAVDDSEEHFRDLRSKLELAVDAYQKQKASEDEAEQRLRAVLEKLTPEDREILGFSKTLDGS